jgi:hypothetical protein
MTALIHPVKACVLLLLLAHCAQPVHAFRRVATTAAPFLKLGEDARSAGMAGATVAQAGAWEAEWSGAGNLQVNAASLAGAQGRSFLLSHEQRMADLRHGALGLSLPLGEGSAVSLGASWLQAPDQEITTLEDPEGTGATYSYGDLALRATMSTRLSDRLAVGGSVKWVRQDLHREHAQGAAMDLGLLLDTGWRHLRLGMALANFGPRLRLEGEDLLVDGGNGQPALLETQEFQLPLLFRVGLSDRLWQHEGQRLDVAVQAEHPNDSRQNVRLGLEYAWRERFFLRGGRHLHRDLEQSAVGLGLRLPLGEGRFVSLDYAWTAQERFTPLQLITLAITY